MWAIARRWAVRVCAAASATPQPDHRHRFPAQEAARRLSRRRDRAEQVQQQRADRGAVRCARQPGWRRTDVWRLELDAGHLEAGRQSGHRRQPERELGGALQQAES
ncbi:hypothetical protein G6F23_013526 [Rhizopus arrhizus]|nr:hypothetical protein G6F23_013526 [Rhizopus arrhizus]